MFLLALISAAWSASSCEKLDSSTFRASVVDAQTAIFRDDLDIAAAQIERIVDNVSCMTFAPEPRLWADLLMAIAVVNYANQQEWEAPLAAALRIRPATDRLVGVAHPIYAWTPSPSPPLQPITTRNRVYIDGTEVQAMPPPQGWYLVQKTDGGAWNTTWQRVGSLSTAWLTSPVERPPRLGWEVELSAAGGFFTTYQTRVGRRDESPVIRSVYDMDPPRDYKADFSAYNCGSAGCGLFFGPEVTVRTTFFSRVGLAAYGTLVFGRRPGLRDLHGTVQFVERKVIIGVGAVVFDLPLARFERPFEHENGVYIDQDRTKDERADYRSTYRSTLTYLVDGRPFAAVEVVWKARDSFRVSGLYGFNWLTSHMGEIGGQYRFAPSAVLQGRPFIGAFGRAGFGMLEQRDQPENRLWTHRVETGLRVGMAFGAMP